MSIVQLCDGCGTVEPDIAATLKLNRRLIKRLKGKAAGTTKIEVCEKCWDEFITWLDRKNKNAVVRKK